MKIDRYRSVVVFKKKKKIYVYSKSKRDTIFRDKYI